MKSFHLSSRNLPITNEDRHGWVPPKSSFNMTHPSQFMNHNVMPFYLYVATIQTRDRALVINVGNCPKNPWKNERSTRKNRNPENITM
jgi:hypothetical protein